MYPCSMANGEGGRGTLANAELPPRTGAWVGSCLTRPAGKAVPLPTEVGSPPPLPGGTGGLIELGLGGIANAAIQSLPRGASKRHRSRLTASTWVPSVEPRIDPA